MRKLAACSAVIAALLAAVAPAAAQIRSYYVAADPVLWNYVPSGTDLAFGRALPPLFPLQMGYTFHKLIYREYTDASFKTLAQRSPGDRYLGIIGPVMHAEVGDTIVVTFKNNAPLPLTLEPMGGIAARPAKPVPTGAIATYRWNIDENAGPGPADASSRLLLYGPNGDHPGAAMIAGLLGPIVVTRAGGARPDGSPKDVDHEVFAAFREMNEVQSALFKQNIADPLTNPKHLKGDTTALLPQNFTISINGYEFGNTPMIVVRRGERVRWYVFDSNSDGDQHIPTWNGNTVLLQGHREDSLTLGDTQPDVADMIPDDVGTWLFYCTLNIHFEGGMYARYRVVP